MTNNTPADRDAIRAEHARRVEASADGTAVGVNDQVQDFGLGRNAVVRARDVHNDTPENLLRQGFVYFPHLDQFLDPQSIANHVNDEFTRLRAEIAELKQRLGG